MLADHHFIIILLKFSTRSKTIVGIQLRPVDKKVRELSVVSLGCLDMNFGTIGEPFFPFQSQIMCAVRLEHSTIACRLFRGWRPVPWTAEILSTLDVAKYSLDVAVCWCRQ